MARILVVLGLALSPACLALDAPRSSTDSSVTSDGTYVSMPALRDRLRASLRPVFELSLLAVGGVAAVIVVTLRCRRQERARLQNLRHLRLLSSFETSFPDRLTAELRRLLAQINGRAEILAHETEDAARVRSGIQDDAQTFAEILKGCERLAQMGPALRTPPYTPIDAGVLLGRLSGRSFETPGPVIHTDADLFALALGLLLRLSRATQETPITFHSLPGPEPETKPASRPHSERRSTLVIRSALNHTLPDFNAGLAVSQRILLHLGGKLTITTEHSAGSNLEVELPA